MRLEKALLAFFLIIGLSSVALAVSDATFSFEDKTSLALTPGDEFELTVQVASSADAQSAKFDLEFDKTKLQVVEYTSLITATPGTKYDNTAGTFNYEGGHFSAFKTKDIVTIKFKLSPIAEIDKATLITFKSTLLKLGGTVISSEGQDLTISVVRGDVSPTITKLDLVNSDNKVELIAGDQIFCYATVTDDSKSAAKVNFNWYTNDGTVPVKSQSVTVSGDGVYSDQLTGVTISNGLKIKCSAEAEDGTGKQTPVTKTLTVDDTLPILNSISYSPIPAYKGTLITVTASASDADCADKSCITPTWNFVDGPVAISLNNALQTSFTPQTAGNYTYNLSLGYDLDLPDPREVVTIEVFNRAPVANIASANGVEVDTFPGLALTATISDPDMDQLAYVWNFGEKDSPWGKIQYIDAGGSIIKQMISQDNTVAYTRACVSEQDITSYCTVDEDIQKISEGIYKDEEHCACLSKLDTVYSDPDFNIYSLNNQLGGGSTSINKVYSKVSNCNDLICDATGCEYDVTDNICTIKLLVSDGEGVTIASKSITVIDTSRAPIGDIQLSGHDSFKQPSEYILQITELGSKTINLDAAASQYFDPDYGYKRDLTSSKLEYVWDTGKVDEPWGEVTINPSLDMVYCEPTMGDATCYGEYGNNNFQNVMITDSKNVDDPADGDICYCKESTNSLYIGKIMDGQKVTQSYKKDSCGAEYCEVKLTVTDKISSKTVDEFIYLKIETPSDGAPYFIDVVNPVEVDLDPLGTGEFTVKFGDDNTNAAKLIYNFIEENAEITIDNELLNPGELKVTVTAPEEVGTYTFQIKITDPTTGAGSDNLFVNVNVGEVSQKPEVSIATPVDGTAISIGEKFVLTATNIKTNIKIDSYDWHTGKTATAWGTTKFVGTDILCVASDEKAQCLRDSPLAQYNDISISSIDEPCTCDIKYVDKQWNIYPDAVLSKTVPSAVVQYDSIDDCENGECEITLRARTKEGKISDPVTVSVRLQTAAGDFNGDGASDDKDSELLLDYILGAKDEGDFVNIDNTDVDMSGSITINDYILHWDEYGK